MSLTTYPLKTNVNGSSVELSNQILGLILEGTLPRSQFDEIRLTKSTTANSYQYDFYYSNVRQFYVTVSDPGSAFTVTITEVNNVLLENDGGVVLLENDDEVFLEA